MTQLSRTLIWVLLMLFASLSFAQDEELLEPDKAFAVSANGVDERHVTVTWEIADGYYMYRDKFGFEAGDNARVVDIRYPAGTIKSDEFFGDVEVYFQRASFVVELAEPAEQVLLTLKGQGCNEPIGVCYAPMSKEIMVKLPFTAASAQAPADPGLDSISSSQGRSAPLSNEARGNDAVDELRDLLGNIGGEDEFLDVDDAFQLSLEAESETELIAHFKVADGYYLYQDKIRFAVRSGAARVAEPRLPTGVETEDEFFGRMQVYFEDFDVQIPLLRASPESSSIIVEAEYQGCANKGICYPPVTKSYTLDLPNLVGTAHAGESAPTQPVDTQADPSPTPTATTLTLLLSAFGIGLLLTFTPCVLPMIPILSSVIVGQGSTMTRAKGGILSSVYVLGTAVTYAAIGWVAGSTGDQLQAYFQNIWAIGALVVVFVVMALSMFGLFKIQMPSVIQSRLQERSSGLGGGTIQMVFVLGLVSALIVGACVSPLLISVLTIAISRADALLGASMMLAMALGMGVFLIALGFGAGALLPRAGAWMERVNHVFGVMLLAVAIYLLGAVQAVPVLLLWAALMIIVGVYMGATQALPEGAGGWRYFAKGIGTIVLVWGVLCLIGGLAGNRDVMNPIPAGTFGATDSRAPGSAPAKELFVHVSNLEELDAQMERARNANKYLMLDYYADWCIDCVRMEQSTFADPEVRRRFDNDFHLVQVDVTDPNHEGGKSIKQRYGVYGPPAILFFTPQGDEIRDLRLYGFRSSAEFLQILDRI